MGIEIERKFLVHPESLPKMDDGVRILQGYLSEKPSIRFRIIGSKIIITIKRLQKDGSRFELETEKDAVLLVEQNEMIALALYPPIEKVRYRIPYQGLVWEVDVYQGDNQGLITADVELPRLDYPVVFPNWIDSQTEITTNPKYFNYNLGRFPYSRWENT